MTADDFGKYSIRSRRGMQPPGREFVDCIHNGLPVTQSGEANLKTFEATFAAYASSRERRVVDVADFITLR